jgi:hypothetical protein
VGEVRGVRSVHNHEIYMHILVTKLQLKKLLGKPKCRERDNIKMDLREIENMSTDGVQMN